MKGSIGVLLIAIGITIYELPKLIKNSSKREIWSFSILMILGTALGIAKSLDMNIPNPLILFNAIYKPFNNIFN